MSLWQYGVEYFQIPADTAYNRKKTAKLVQERIASGNLRGCIRRYAVSIPEPADHGSHYKGEVNRKYQKN